MNSPQPPLWLCLAIATACGSDEPKSETVTEFSDSGDVVTTEDTQPPADTGEPVDADGDGWVWADDCDDENAAVHPDAVEVCNGIDDDCDRLIDDSDDSLSLVGLPTFYEDADGDGYGNAEVTREACEQPEGFAEQAGDCDELRPGVHPDTEEVCGSGFDDDCDGGYAPECGLDAISNEGIIDVEEPLDIPLEETRTNPFSLRVAAFDLNGDGTDDVVVGDPSLDAGTGTAGALHVLWGGTEADVDVVLSSGSDSSGTTATGGGRRVLALSDINGNGRADLAVASNEAIWLVESGDLLPGESALLSVVGTLLIGTASVVPADLTTPGDIDDDGLAELIVSEASAGIYLFTGTQTASAATLSLSDAVYLPATACNSLGSEGTSTGLDLNGDGFSDLVAGCPYWSSGGRGRAVVFDGSTLPSRLGAGGLDILPEDACISKTSGNFDKVGRLVSSAGDLNHDGYPDLAVSDQGTLLRVFGGSADWFASTGCTAEAGQRAPEDADITLDVTDASATYRSTSRVVPHADLTGDGMDDLLVMNLNVGDWSGAATFFTGGAGWEDVPTTPTHTLRGERDARLQTAVAADPWQRGVPTLFMPAVEAAPSLRSLSIPGY